MCKKVLIAALAAVVGLMVVKGTWIGSHFRHMVSSASRQAKDWVPPEREIARLRTELENLGREDDRHYDKVARQAVEVERLERQVAELRKNLQARETSIRTMRASLEGESEFVTYNGERFKRADMVEQVRLDARNFQADEETLLSKEEHLKAVRQSLMLNKKKLSDLRVAREQMATELQKLQTALEQERQAQARSEQSIDDGAYRKIREEMESVRDRIELLKKKRELKGEAVEGPVRAAEQRREQDARIDRYLEKRFGQSGKQVFTDNQ